MFRSVSRLLLICCCAAQFLSGRAAFADLVKLKGGGELRGVFLDKISTGRGTTIPVRVETLTGGVVTVSPDDVLLLAKRSRTVEEYEWRSRLAERTVEARWELQEWCRQQGLKKERDAELQLVVALDPNHEQAHRLLGHLKQGARWMSRDAAMAAKGYVKYKGKYLFPQEVELLESSAAQRDAELGWFKKLHAWQGWLRGSNPALQLDARRELTGIVDLNAVSPLVQTFRNDPDDDVRLIFVEVLSRLQENGGSRATVAIQALVIQSLFDSSAAVRSAALTGITGKSRDIAIPIYNKALADELNPVVLRSANALAHFGDVDSVPNLIAALETTHTYQQVVTETGYLTTNTGAPVLANTEIILPARGIPLSIPGVPLPVSASSGAFIPGSGQSVSVPLPIPVTRERLAEVTRTFQNVEVLSALRKLTKEDFGFDKRTWSLWWTSHKSGPKHP